MSEHVKPVMVVHPDVATPSVRKALREAGYTVVVSDHPELFRAIDAPLPPLSIDAIARAALETVRLTTYDGIRNAFAKRLLARLAPPQEGTGGKS